MTIFLGCGFAAKYLEGGGVLSVPLQWMLGLRRLKHDAIWLELLPATNDARADQAKIDNFQRRMREYGLGVSILSALGVQSMRLLTNNPRKRAGVETHGLIVSELLPIEIPASEFTRRYLQTKKEKLGHLLSSV